MHTQAPLGLDSLTSHSAFPSYIYTKRGNVKGGRRIFSEQRQPGVVYRAICTNKHDSTPQSWDARNGPHEQNGNGDSASETGYIVREARSEGEYQDAGWLRAVAYYEVKPCCNILIKQSLEGSPGAINVNRGWRSTLRLLRSNHVSKYLNMSVQNIQT